MATTTFIDNSTLIQASWLNDVNTATYTDIPAIKANSWVTTARIADGAVTGVKFADNSITNLKLADNAVTTTKILDANITPAKLSAGAPTWDSSGIFTVVGTGRVAVYSSDATPLILNSSSSGGANLKLTSTFGSPSAPDKYLRVNSGTFEIINSAYSAPLLQVYDTGDLSFNSGYGSTKTAYGCRAWVNFNGTGTVAIRGSGNVSSITDNGVGDYIVNFATAMVDTNYAACVTETLANGIVGGVVGEYSSSATTRATTSTTAFRLQTLTLASAAQDNPSISVSFFR